jgi:Zn/Cd-binding protein ZinT
MPRRKAQRPGAQPRYFKSTGEHAAAIGMIGATVKDLSEFQAATTRVYELLKDGEWHTVHAIRAAAVQHEATRRLRELRQCGYQIERRAIKDGLRTQEYRIVNPEETTTEQREAQTFAHNRDEDWRGDVPHPKDQQ